MKKTCVTALAALLLAVPAVQAQKVNKDSFLSKIEKSDADIADVKKGAKAATWVNRGKLFFEAVSEPTKDLFLEMDPVMLKFNDGDPQSTSEVTLLDVPYTAYVYPYYTAYVKDNKIMAWTQTQEIYPGALELSLEAYNKAYDMDPKTASKVKVGLKQISDFCAQAGDVSITTGKYADAAKYYMTAYAAQSSPAYGEKPNLALLYYAGYLKTVEGSTNPEAYAEGADYLNRALEQGYTDEDGNIYYYLFHCYYGQKDKDAAFVMKSKDALLEGIEKFPKSERILDGLMQLYTAEKGVGDPADLVTMIDAAIAENPTNTDLWFGRGRIFYALKNYDESIKSFEKIVELKPDMYEGNYYLGFFYALKGDAMNKEMNERQYSSQADYDADLKTVNAVYMAAVPWFEKVLELKPNDPDAVEFLKSLCFRLRDEEGMMDKYKKYNDLYNQIKGN